MNGNHNLNLLRLVLLLFFGEVVDDLVNTKAEIRFSTCPAPSGTQIIF